MSRLSAYSLAVAGFALALASTPVYGATTVLTLRAGPTALPAWPISTGVPFPRGALASIANLRLEDGASKEVMAQFQPLAQWPDRSMKSVLVTLVAPVASTASSTYTLHYGTGVTRSVPATPLQVAQDASSITVTTGPIRFQLQKSRFALFDTVWVDQNRDAAYDPSERVIVAPGDIYIVDAFTGKEHRSSLYLTPSYTVLEAGPVRSVIHVTGALQALDGSRLTQFRVWITAWAGSSYVELDYTLVDPRDEADVTATRAQLALSLSSWGIRVPTALSSPTFAFGGENDQVYTAPVTATHSLYQSGKLNYVDGDFLPYSLAYSGVGAGRKAPGWFDLSGGGLGVSILARDFWQQFPKQLTVAGANMTIELHPANASLPTPDLSYPTLDPTTKRWERPNTFYAAREGTAKTYEFLFDFHTGDAAQEKPWEINKMFQSHRLPLVATSPWYARSEVFGKIIETGSWSAGYDQYLYDGIYDTSVTPFEDTGGLAVQYGWADFGDRMRGGWADVVNGVRIPAWYNDTHIAGGHNFIVQYLRTMDDRWFALGDTAARHFMDRDVSHCNRAGYWTGSFGPGEAYLINHNVMDHHSRNLHWGHAHLSGLPEVWLLTGDYRAREVIDEIGTWWTKASQEFFPVPYTKPHFAEASRDYGRPLFAMTEAYRATGDVRHLKGAAQLVRHLLAWWREPQPHMQNGNVVGTHDWTQGAGWLTMYPKCDNCPTGWNGTSGPWMDGDFLHAMIQFYEANKPYKLVSSTLVEELMLQILDYDVKWGWVDPPGHFCYSEEDRSDGGQEMLLYPLAYLWALGDSGAGINPAWYSTRSMWKDIAKAAYLDWQIVKWRGSQSYGWYGYEMFPPQFFEVMRDLELKGKL